MVAEDSEETITFGEPDLVEWTSLNCDSGEDVTLSPLEEVATQFDIPEAITLYPSESEAMEDSSDPINVISYNEVRVAEATSALFDTEVTVDEIADFFWTDIRGEVNYNAIQSDETATITETDVSDAPVTPAGECVLRPVPVLETITLSCEEDSEAV